MPPITLANSEAWPRTCTAPSLALLEYQMHGGTQQLPERNHACGWKCSALTVYPLDDAEARCSSVL